jgi:methionyl-tRNA formyltransferase
MKITLLCSDELHPVNGHLARWMRNNEARHDIVLVRQTKDLPGGDVLFLISCTEILRAEDRAGYGASLVLHASDLPQGRGWSPHIWQIIGGAREITLSLIEAGERVDSGRIWCQTRFAVPKDALWDEINQRLFDAEVELMDSALQGFDTLVPREQSPDVAPTYFARRTPADSRIDPLQSIASQFDRIRVCDPQRFPAFFELHGCRYTLKLEKVDD